MTDDDRMNGPGVGLWRRARAAWAEGEAAGAVVDEEPDALLLAAYIDGRLDARACERLEARLLAANGGVDLLVFARAATAAPTAPVPDAVIGRAQALVRAPARVGRVSAWWSRTVSPIVWSGVAAALLLAAVSGFELGRLGVERLAALDQTMTEDVRLVMGTPRDEIL